MDEYTGIAGRIKFFWRFRCVKLRLIMEVIGLITVFTFGAILLGATIYQWHLPDHTITFVWNRYNEAFLEYIWALISIPCAIYFLKISGARVMKKWERG